MPTGITGKTHAHQLFGISRAQHQIFLRTAKQSMHRHQAGVGALTAKLDDAAYKLLHTNFT
jgi:hypothetical protein